MRGAARILQGLVVLVAAIYLVALLGHTVLGITYPLQLEYGEGVTYAICDVVAQGRVLYQDLNVFPWVHVTYTPLYLLAVGELMRTVSWTFVPGRTLSAVSFAVTMVLFYRLLALRQNRRSAVVAVLLFSCNGLVFSWPCLLRVDFPAMAVEMAALLALHRQRHALAGVLAMTAFLVKPSILSVLFGITLYLAWTRRDGLRPFVLGFGATAVASFAVLFAVYGTAFFKQVFAYNNLGLDPGYAWTMLKTYLPSVLLVWLLACLGRRPDRLWLCYLVGSLVTGSLLLRATSFYNHFLDLQLATSALAAWSLEERLLSAPAWLPATGWALVLLQIAGPGGCTPLEYLYAPMQYVRYELPAWSRGEAVRWWAGGVEIQRELSLWLAQHPGPALAENTGTMLACGRRSLLVDPVPTLTLGERGVWNEAPFLDLIRQRRFVVIMLQADRFPAPVRSLILANYAVDARVGDLETLYVPRP